LIKLHDDERQWQFHFFNIGARNNAFIDRNFKEHDPTQEVYAAIHNNFFELYGIARASFYP
jgi:hypothetical protein